GPASLRALSLVLSVAAIAVLFVVVRDLSGTTPALWAALLMALAGPQIQYAQEARNYSLLLLEGLGAAATLVRIEKYGPSRPRAATLIVCVLAMALTHYFSIGAIAALAVYAAVRLRGPSLRRVAGCFILAAALWCVVGAPLAVRHWRNRDDPRATSFLRDDRPGHAARTLLRVAALPVRFIAEPMTTSRGVAAAGGVVFVLALLLALRRRDLLLWSIWLWLTVLPLAALDLCRRTQHLEFVRYTLLASPALYAIAATLLSDRRERWIRHLPPLLVALACALALPAAYSAWWKSDWRALAGEIDRHARPGDVVVFWGYDKGGDFAGDPNASFYYTSYYRRRPLGPIVLMDQPPDDALARQLSEFAGVLVVAPPGQSFDEIARGSPRRRLASEPPAAALWRIDAPTPP
ncbi:MAG: mannosyltransferase, partial [Phycisphaerales bacterium]|nr:mannosyltransferase [Phycisphaerales bacterium]